MARLENIDLNPQPQAWPACAECKEPFVLRHAIVFTRGERPTAGSTGPFVRNTLGFEWTWQRDCKHRRAEVITQVAKPVKKRRARR